MQRQKVWYTHSGSGMAGRGADVPEGKKSQVVLEWDHDTCTMQIGGNAANYDLAIAMCDTARRHFERLLNGATASKLFQAAGRVPFDFTRGKS